jgi:Domain of unknown function (DUF4412)
MKKTFTLFFLTASFAAFAQPKVLTQAMITTKTTIVAPESDEPPVQTSTSADGGEVRVMRFGGDGETKTTTWLKNDLVKTLSESEMGRTTLIRDNSKKITTTIMEMMGRKSGYYATDEEQAEMRKRMDSMMKSRGVNIPGAASPTAAPTYSVIYVDGDKKVAGYACKKALLIAARPDRTDTTSIWYCPDFKLQNLPNTGGMAAGFGGFSPATGATGMELINGFPMQYERNMNRGRHMTVEVTKLIIDKDVADKEFEVPKDIEVKSAKDMQNGGFGGPMIQIRAGG